jgi:hypothetical protein
LKGELAVRPIYHQRENRIEAHLFVAFIAYLHSGHLEAPVIDTRFFIDSVPNGLHFSVTACEQADDLVAQR